MKSRDRLLILADDLTGALDSGVQLARKGQNVVILTDRDVPFPEEASADVMVIDTETRHVDPGTAAQIVETLVRIAAQHGYERIYKKTDSGLRGNIGAELEAVLKASGRDHLNFIPAYPATDRKTIDGVQYVNGQPLAESIFAHDPINPITVSRVDELIHQQSRVPAGPAEAQGQAKKGIVVYDAESNEDLKRIADELQKEDDFVLTGGCAGFLEVFPVAKQQTSIPEIRLTQNRLLVLSGSVNEITRSQLTYARQQGGLSVHVPMDLIVKGKWTRNEKQRYLHELIQNAGDNPLILVDTLGEISEDLTLDPGQLAEVIAENMGCLANEIADTLPSYVMMIIGGDTLQGFIRSRHIQELHPIAEIDPGIVAASYEESGTEHYIITKSGAFGSPDQLIRILNWIQKHQK